MADAFVGTWKIDGSSVTGFKEYFDAVGKPEHQSKYNTSYVSVVTKTGDNEYKAVTSGKDWDQTLEETFKIGQKSKHYFAGFGDLEAVTTLEGNKLVRTANPGGVQLKTVRYIDGNEMVVELFAGTTKAVARLMKC